MWLRREASMPLSGSIDARKDPTRPQIHTFHQRRVLCACRPLLALSTSPSGIWIRARHTLLPRPGSAPDPSSAASETQPSAGSAIHAPTTRFPRGAARRRPRAPQCAGAGLAAAARAWCPRTTPGTRSYATRRPFEGPGGGPRVGGMEGRRRGGGCARAGVSRDGRGRAGAPPGRGLVRRGSAGRRRGVGSGTNVVQGGASGGHRRIGSSGGTLRTRSFPSRKATEAFRLEWHGLMLGVRLSSTKHGLFVFQKQNLDFRTTYFT